MNFLEILDVRAGENVAFHPFDCRVCGVRFTGAQEHGAFWMPGMPDPAYYCCHGMAANPKIVSREGVEIVDRSGQVEKFMSRSGRAVL